ncbi:MULTISPECIES: hypothetical protein [unclassified Sphingobium]|uniref:hypothetical protein n=1 Tax=unclassified Sphingobium TaxID=2611147 RepID=UPI00222467D5|nr:MULTISPECIES: hypothetical protein [unclassified Sphingobium]MCW2350233.1 putative GIY-YIG superfamily endonuclease [Sphingobium sp. B12D2B]MCW2369337.1 putative GIY-YIG superfamily endonuclease [Sphingobium sp. B11D3D]
MQGAEAKESIYRIDRHDDGSLRFHSIAPGQLRRFPDAATVTTPCLTLPAEAAEPALARAAARKSSTCNRASQYPAICWPDLGPGESLNAFGMFWKRELVPWSGPPLLLGRRTKGTPLFNFARQVGLYLLQDGARTVYVGRASNDLYARLKTHTTDRLAGRWNRFSWFGLRDASQHLPFAQSACWSEANMLRTMEALLIETLEPPLNRRGGDGLSGREFLQASAPTSLKSRHAEARADTTKKPRHMR